MAVKELGTCKHADDSDAPPTRASAPASAAEWPGREIRQLAGSSLRISWPTHTLASLRRTFRSDAKKSRDQCGEASTTLGAYVRFIWVVAMGGIDVILVLVLLLWPESDFMCRRYSAGQGGGVVQELDVIIVIGAILLLHFSDVVSGSTAAVSEGYIVSK